MTLLTFVIFRQRFYKRLSESTFEEVSMEDIRDSAVEGNQITIRASYDMEKLALYLLQLEEERAMELAVMKCHRLIGDDRNVLALLKSAIDRASGDFRNNPPVGEAALEARKKIDLMKMVAERLDGTGCASV